MLSAKISIFEVNKDLANKEPNDYMLSKVSYVTSKDDRSIHRIRMRLFSHYHGDHKAYE
jgi:hypothetical protein